MPSKVYTEKYQSIMKPYASSGAIRTGNVKNNLSLLT